MLLNANKSLALHVIEQQDASSKWVQQMSLISRDLIWEEWINKTLASNYRWRWWRGEKKKGRRRKGTRVLNSCGAGMTKRAGGQDVTAGHVCVTCASLMWMRRVRKWNQVKGGAGALPKLFGPQFHDHMIVSQLLLHISLWKFCLWAQLHDNVSWTPAERS